VRRQFCPVLPSNRTKVFHVKRFGPIDGLRKCTFARRGEVRVWDLAQAATCDRVYALASAVFFETVSKALPSSCSERRGGSLVSAEACTTEAGLRMHDGRVIKGMTIPRQLILVIAISATILGSALGKSPKPSTGGQSPSNQTIQLAAPPTKKQKRKLMLSLPSKRKGSLTIRGG
jgi:hypothetical protein